MLIREAKEDDLHSIVDVHLQSFEGFFLTFLGPSFLAVLYRCFIEFEGGIIKVAVDDDNNVIGFAAGTVEPGDFFPLIKSKRGYKFLMAAMPSMFKKPKIVFLKLYNAFFYKGDKPVELQKTALLSSIAVLPNHSGKSVGKKLLSDFENQLKLYSADKVYLTTDRFSNDSVVRFYLNSGYTIESEFTQSGGRQMLRLIKSL